MNSTIARALLIVCFWATACPLKADEPIIITKTFDTSHLWEGSLDIGQTPAWDGKHRAMTISPTETTRGSYSPHGLLDAMRELDRMLPASYVSVAASQSTDGRCLKDVGDNVIDLHNSLADFGYEAWLMPKKAEFRRYLTHEFDLKPPSRVVAEEFDREAGMTAVAWTLCYYYQAKHNGYPPNISAAKADLGQKLEKLRERWKVSLYRQSLNH